MFFDKDQGIKDDFIGEANFTGEEFLSSHMSAGQLKSKLDDKSDAMLELALFRVPMENLVQFDIEVENLPKMDYAQWARERTLRKFRKIIAFSNCFKGFFRHISYFLVITNLLEHVAIIRYG